MSVKALPVITRRALRFAITGLLATGLHAVVAIVFIKQILNVPAIANGVAFVVATLVSYILNTMWTFSHLLQGRTLYRFCAVSCIGLGLAMLVSGVAQYWGLNYLWGILFVVLTVPPVTFVMHSLWTYRGR